LANYFKKEASLIVMLFSLKELKKNSMPMKTLEKECERLRTKEAQVMSAIFVNKKYMLLLTYYAYCLNGVTSEVKSKSYLTSSYLLNIMH